MTPLTQSVPISQTLATQPFVGGSHVYQPLSIQDFTKNTGIEFPQNYFGLLNSFAISKIKESIKALSNLEGVESVKAIFQNEHSFIFEVKLSALSKYERFDEDDSEFEYEVEYEIDSNHSRQLEDEVENLVLEACCHLRNTTGEKWYFFTEIV